MGLNEARLQAYDVITEVVVFFLNVLVVCFDGVEDAEVFFELFDIPFFTLAECALSLLLVRYRGCRHPCPYDISRNSLCTPKRHPTHLCGPVLSCSLRRGELSICSSFLCTFRCIVPFTAAPSVHEAHPVFRRHRIRIARYGGIDVGPTWTCGSKRP